MDTVNSCIVFKIPTPDGTMFLTVIEDSNGNPTSVRIEIGKAGTTIRAYTEAIMLIINKYLDKGGSLHDIIESFSSTTTNRIIYTTGKVPIRSGPEGIVYGLIRYMQSKYSENEDEWKREVKFPRILPRHG